MIGTAIRATVMAKIPMEEGSVLDTRVGEGDAEEEISSTIEDKGDPTGKVTAPPGDSKIDAEYVGKVPISHVTPEISIFSGNLKFTDRDQSVEKSRS